MRKTIPLLLAALFGMLPGRALAQDEAVAAGAEIYAADCAVCHGERLRNPGTSFDLREFRADERARFEQAVLDGKGQMPPWRGVLSDEQRDQIWAYIRAYAYE